VLPYAADIPDFCDFFSPGAQDVSSSRPFFDQNYYLRQVRSPQAELPLLVFEQVVLPSWMIFKSEMVGLNDRAAPEFCNVRYGSGDTPGLCTQFPKDLELFIARTSSKRAILILGCGAAQWRH
jgi:hypothetical protein